MGKIRAKLFLLDDSARWADQGPGWVDVSPDYIIMFLDAVPGVSTIRQVAFQPLNDIQGYQREGGSFFVFFSFWCIFIRLFLDTLLIWADPATHKEYALSFLVTQGREEFLFLKSTFSINSLFYSRLNLQMQLLNHPLALPSISTETLEPFTRLIQISSQNPNATNRLIDLLLSNVCICYTYSYLQFCSSF